MEAWNDQRKLALERALSKSLYPQMEKELKLCLLQETKDGILRVSCDFITNSSTHLLFVDTFLY